MNKNVKEDTTTGIHKYEGKRIRLLREELGYSQDKLANLIPSCTKQSLYRLENNKTINPDLALLKLLAYHLECTVDYILGDSPDPKTYSNGLRPAIIFEPYAELINAYKENKNFGELFIKCSQLLSKSDRKALEQIMSSLLDGPNTLFKSTSTKG